MSYANEFTSQSRFYTSDGLSREVMSACEPLGNLGVSLMEHPGKVFLAEPLFFQNLTQSLGNTERQIELCLLLGRYCSEAITEKFILYHNY